MLSCRYVLHNALMNLMDIYGDGDGVSEAQCKELKADVRQQIRDKGLLKSSGTGVYGIVNDTPTAGPGCLAGTLVVFHHPPEDTRHRYTKRGHTGVFGCPTRLSRLVTPMLHLMCLHAALLTSAAPAQSVSAGSGAHCWGCGIEGDDEVPLLTCSRCKNARYCAKECQVRFEAIRLSPIVVCMRATTATIDLCHTFASPLCAAMPKP